MTTAALAGLQPGRCFIIGEVGLAHDGSLGYAHAFIDEVARGGADAVKFQTHIAAAESTPGEPFRVKGSGQDKTRYDYWKRMEFTEDQWRALADHAREKGLVFLSSPFSPQAVEMLERLGMAMWKVAPALAAGNVVILKPASQTPLTAIAFGEIATEVGLPPGVLNVVTGGGSTVGQALVEHPGIDKIAFTGDTATGRQIMRSAADTLKHVTLELGGKSPNIVFPDADLDAAIRGATVGIFYGKGEVCAAGSRLLVDRSIKDQFLDKVAARTKKMVPGDPEWKFGLWEPGN